MTDPMRPRGASWILSAPKCLHLDWNFKKQNFEINEHVNEYS